MIQHKAYKFRIYPNAEQRVLLAKTFGSVRFVYNHFLGVKTKAYEETKASVSYTRCAAELVKLKKENPFLKEVDSIALQQSLRHLETAFQNFFRDKKVGYPKFKSKKQHHYSYSSVCVNNNIRLENGVLVLPKIGKVRIRQHRMIPKNYTLKSVTISQTPSGKYYVSILFDMETEPQSIELTRAIGLDFSMSELFVSSEDDIQTDEQFLRHYRRSQEKLAREQRILSHRKKGSNRYNKQRRKVAILHEKVCNQRKDYLHKVSRQIANAYDIVCVEDLNMQDMAQIFHFGKSVSDNGWGMFLGFLDYKLADAGKILIRIDKWYASSKTCHVCGYINEGLTLKDRNWECPKCYTIHGRDKNAAHNIKAEGLRIAFA